MGQLLQQANLPDKSANSACRNYMNDWKAFLTSINEAAGVDVSV